MLRTVIERELSSKAHLQDITCRFISSAGAHARGMSSTSSAELSTPNDESKDVHEPCRKDISRLRETHLDILHQRRRNDQVNSWIHTTEKFNRSLLGKYGELSGVNPKICFATKSETIAPESELGVLLENMAQQVKAKNDIQQAILLREKAIENKMAKLDQWKNDLTNKIAKKEADAKAAIARKARLIEEVRRHFGFTLDPRDDRFKEMLERKEREDRKKMKEAKRERKENKVIEQILSTTTKD